MMMMISHTNYDLIARIISLFIKEDATTINMSFDLKCKFGLCARFIGLISYHIIYFVNFITKKMIEKTLLHGLFKLKLSVYNVQVARLINGSDVFDVPNYNNVLEKNLNRRVSLLHTTWAFLKFLFFGECM